MHVQSELHVPYQEYNPFQHCWRYIFNLRVVSIRAQRYNYD